jgi:hypothetical protein
MSLLTLRTGWRPLVGLAVVAALCQTSPALAQTTTTGRIVGTVVDQQGAAVPGVTVTATSPQLQGSRTSVTDSSGEFRFLAFPPGNYLIKAELSGFQTVERSDVQVNTNATVTLPLTMAVAGVSTSVDVVAASPVVDTTSTTGGIVANADVFNNIPMRRDFYNVARLAPGASPDAIGAAGARAETANQIGTGMGGATGAENQYIIDGVNVTGMQGGEQTKTINMDFVQEVQVMTTGLNAEYGRMNGGIISVVTQSGGNAFHGSGFAFYEGGALVSDNSTTPLRAQTTTTILNTKPIRDGGGSLGGYFLKDKLWFFGAFDRTASRDQRTIIRALSAPGSPALGSQVPSDVTTNNYAAKLTWRASNNHSIWVSTNGEPSTRDGYVFAIAGPPSTWQGTLERGAPNVNLHYDGVFGSTLLVRGIFGLDQEKTTYGGAGAATSRSTDQTVTPNVNTGGFGGYTNEDFKRKVYKGDVTKFWGAHEIKAGADYEDILTRVERFDGGGGQSVFKLRVAATGLIYYRHRFFVNDLASGFVRGDPSTWTIANPLVSAPGNHNTSFYAQDNFKVMSNLSINYGIRWERQNGLDRNLETAYDMKKNWAPRVGFVWDPTKSGKAKVFASFGRYFDNMPLDMNIRQFGGELECFCNNLDPGSSTSPSSAAPASQLRGAGIEKTDPTLKGMYSDEATGGFEYEWMPHTSVGIKISNRRLGRAIEDFLDNVSGEYFIGNPSEGTFGKTMGSFAGTDVPAPKPERKHTSVELSLRKRYSNNWQFLASYVFSKLEGNYDGSYQVSTGQLDPGINSAYDYADFLVNAFGPLSSERKNQLKLDGSYTLSRGILSGLTVGASLHWFSGLPLTAYGYSFPYGNWEYYLTPRGSLGRSPADYEADVQVMYPLKLGPNVHADLQLAVFNLFDRQAINQLYSRYNEIADGFCAGIPAAICNGDNGLEHVTGTINPVGQLANPKATATSPDFLKAGIGFTSPRSARIGVRLRF